MQRNFNIEKDFILTDLQVFREYDLNNFVSNAKNSLKQVNDSVSDIKIDTYITFINRSYADFRSTKMQYEEDPTVLEKEFSSVHFEQLNLVMRPIQSERIVIRPEYLSQFVENIGLTFQRAVKNLNSISDVDDEMDKYISADILFKVKKQMVRSNTLSCTSNLKDLIYRDEDVTVPVNEGILEMQVYPFLENYKALRKEIDSDVSRTVSSLRNAKSMLGDYVGAIRNIQNGLEPDNMNGRSKLNKVMYNTVRCAIEASSYLAFALIRKIGNFTESVLSINKLCDDLAGSVSPATESVFDRGLVANDSKAIGDNLLHGEVDAFRELSADTYQYNINLLSSSPFHGTPELEEENIFTTVEFRVDQATYNNKPYEDTLDMISIISQGLDTVAANSDDYLVVFDDILDKSGFSLRLEDKFSGTLNLLDDVSEYESSVGISDACSPSMDMYYKLLKEVRDMPENMEKIAEQFSECDAKINILSERFDRNINTEYRNTATIREVKDFLDNLEEEFHNLAIKVGGKFMIRLKTLAVILEKMNKMNSKNLDADKVQLEYTDEQMYREYAEDVAFEEFITDTLFEAVTDAYVKEKTRLQTGIILYKEDGDESGAGRSTAAAIMEKIDGMIKDLEDQMQKMVIKMQVYSGERYIENHKNNLLNRNYSNVSSKSPIIEYAKIKPYGDMITDSESVNKKVAPGSLTTQKLLELKDDATIVNFVFPQSVSGILGGGGNNQTQNNNNNGGDNNNAADNSPSTQIREFYKHGTYPSNPLTLKNNELKTAVNDAITYCSQFNNGIWNKIMEIDKSIYNNLKEVNNQYKTESNIDYMIGQLFVEDDNNGGNNAGNNTSGGTGTQPANNNGGTANNNTGNNNPPANNNQPQNNNTQQNQNNNQNNQQPNQEANPNSIINATRPIKTIYNMCRTFTNGVMHAAADRYKDYIDLLHGIEAQTENDMDPRDSQEQSQNGGTQPANNPNNGQ